MSSRSIGLPIIVGTITVLLTITLLVLWTWVLIQNRQFTREVAQNTWVLAGGIVSLVAIMSLVVVLSIYLGREILEVRRQNTFIDSVTHELKSPLASLKLCLDTEERPELTAEQRQHLRSMMHADIDRLTAFIDDILTASRLAHENLVHRDKVDIAALVGRCVDGVRKRYELPAEALAVEVPSDLATSTDATALETVLKNLLDNAVKYSDPPVSVALHVRPVADQGIEIEVTDRGIGIPKQHLSRIFSRFFRGTSPAVKARRGTGLGLYVVASLVRNLGGKISAYSPGVGQGTRIVVWLPAARRQVA